MRLPIYLFVALAFAALPQFASADRRNGSSGSYSDNVNQRREVLRLSKELSTLQRELTKELMSSEAMTAAQADFKAAAAEMKSARDLVNEQLLADGELQQMKLELFNLQVQLQTARSTGDSSLDTKPMAKQMLDLRSRIRMIETGVQESVDAFVDARDRLQAAQQDLNDARRDVLEQLKTDPTLAAARERIKAARGSIATARRR